MIRHEYELRVNAHRRENVKEHAPDFPYSALFSDLASYADRCASWHWHNHFEFICITEGTMELHTQRRIYRVNAGEGCFVNANTLHLCRADENCTLVSTHTQLFDHEIIANTGLIGRRYVAPIESCMALDAVHLSPENEDERAILECISAAYAAAEANTDGCEMSISASLISAWQKLYALVEPILKNAGPNSPNEVSRTKTMLGFIHDHYAEEIALEEIAAAADVSERECFRCFKQVLDTTPLAYLTAHRVDIAARLLAESNLSINEIAEKCGFAGASYFGKVFRKLMDCTPSVYRKHCRNMSGLQPGRNP